MTPFCFAIVLRYFQLSLDSKIHLDESLVEWTVVCGFEDTLDLIL